MGDADTDARQRQVARLLGRGGQTLGLAATAHARGQRAGDGPWHVLTPEAVAAAERLLSTLEEGGDPDGLQAAVSAAMGAAPATAARAWAAAAWDDPGQLERIGRAVEDAEIAPALPYRPGTNDESRPVELGARERGLAALAVALGRSVDGVQALAARLDSRDGARLTRMAGLAGVQVEPGAPSRMRAWLKGQLGRGIVDG